MAFQRPPHLLVEVRQYFLRRTSVAIDFDFQAPDRSCDITSTDADNRCMTSGFPGTISQT
jgi:hypothetical protein